MHWGQRLKQLRSDQGLTQSELAQRAGEPITADLIKKYEHGRVEKPRGTIQQQLARGLETTIEYLRDGKSPNRIQKAGYVGAGEVYLPEDLGPDDVLIFDHGLADPIAVEVRGRSMEPVYRERDVLICDRRPITDRATFLNQDCVVKLVTGEGFIKKVTAGSRTGRFTLVSYAREPNPNVELEWAAPVKWIKRA